MSKRHKIEVVLTTANPELENLKSTITAEPFKTKQDDEMERIWLEGQ